MAAPEESRSIPELMSSLTTDLIDLVRKEGQLARTEIAEKLSEATRALRDIAIGAVFLLGAFIVLLQAVVTALSQVMNPVWAALVVVVVVAAVGVVLVQAGARLLKPSNLSPDRSARQLDKDADLMKGPST